jgi:hypothetical protein
MSTHYDKDYIDMLFDCRSKICRGVPVDYTKSGLTKIVTEIEMSNSTALTPVLYWRFIPNQVLGIVFEYVVCSLANFVAGAPGAFTNVSAVWSTTNPSTSFRVNAAFCKVVPTGAITAQNGNHVIGLVPDYTGATNFDNKKATIDTLNVIYHGSPSEVIFCNYLPSDISFNIADPGKDQVFVGYNIMDGVNASKFSVEITQCIEYVPSNANIALIEQEYSCVSTTIITSINRMLQEKKLSNNFILGSLLNRELASNKDFHVKSMFPTINRNPQSRKPDMEDPLSSLITKALRSSKKQKKSMKR